MYDAEHRWAYMNDKYNLNLVLNGVEYRAPEEMKLCIEQVQVCIPWDVEGETLQTQVMNFL